ncbi:MAG: hypothetical protein ACJ735_06415 [Actinomycetes bacterium]
MSTAADERGTISIVNDYRWILDPRLGTIAVYLDGRRAGTVPLRGRLDLVVSAGGYRVRVRLWWFWSLSVEVDVSPGGRSVLRADQPPGPVGRAMLRLMLHPYSAWSLVPDTSGKAIPATVPFATVDERRRKRLILYAFAFLAVFVLLAFLVH